MTHISLTNKPKIILPPGAAQAVSALHAAGYAAYAVGGFVRDSLLGRDVQDCDVCTSALPQAVQALFESRNIRCVLTGVRHGTVTVLIGGEQIEITTFRTDGSYSDARHPDSVTFVPDLKTDLARRDFTVNAMAYGAQLVDPFGGVRDLHSGLIRCVGDPYRRFSEDALRIMRAVRFACVLDFKIEKKTEEALFQCLPQLSKVSVERFFSELCKLLLGTHVCPVLSRYRDVFACMIPELKPCFDYPQKTVWHVYNVYDHICHTVENTPPDLEIRLTMLLHDIGKPACVSYDQNGSVHFYNHPQVSAQLAGKILRRLKAPNHLRKNVCTLIEHHDAYIHPQRRSVLQWLRLIGPELTRKLLWVKLADLKSQNLQKTQPEIEEIEQIFPVLDAALQDGCYKISQLQVNGSDLQACGLQGQAVGQTLEHLLSLVIDEKLTNEKTALLSYVQTHDCKNACSMLQ